MTLLHTQTPTLVYDIGSSSIQFGYAGDAAPLYSIPSSAAQLCVDGDPATRFGRSFLERPAPGIEAARVISDSGAIADRDVLAQFFDWTYQACFCVDSSGCAALVTQPSHLHAQPESLRAWREGICEIALEFAQHPMVCLEHDSALAAFAHSAHTGVVVDFGWSCVRAVPVLNGKPLLKSMGIGHLGGAFLCRCLEGSLAAGGRCVPTRLDAGASESQRRCCARFAAEDIVRTCLAFPPLQSATYYARGGPELNVTAEMQALFAQVWPVQGAKGRTIPECLSASINSNRTPADVRRQLWANIFTSGGLSNLSGFRAELEKFARVRAPENYRATARVHPPMHRITSGQNTVWTGGSILASLDTFPEFSISLEDWREEGVNILQRKCI